MSIDTQRIEVLRTLSSELEIPLSSGCTETDILKLIMASKCWSDRGVEDCFGYLYDAKERDCTSSCNASMLCSRIVEALPSAEDVTLKTLTSGDIITGQTLTRYGFRLGTPAYTVVLMLKARSVSIDDAAQQLESQFGVDREIAISQHFHPTVSELRKRGFSVLYDRKEKLYSMSKDA